MDAEVLSGTLQALADAQTARRVGREVRTLRGVRGVRAGEIARVAAAAWQEQPVDLDRDEAALSTLFATAFEDGLLAIGLLAAALPDAPHDVYEIGLDWLTRVDDHQTADALGWLVLGPARLAAGRSLGELLRRGPRGHPAPRRAVVSSGLALTPEVVQSPAAGALRQRLGQRALRFVEQAADADLAQLASHALHDEEPRVRKALRRVLGAWARDSPEAAERWATTQPAGVPSMLLDAIRRGAQRARRHAGNSE